MGEWRKAEAEGMPCFYKCNYIQDITYMHKPDPPARRQLAPCLREAVWLSFDKEDSEIPTTALCQDHYEAIKYREDRRREGVR
jgi:hypothetical protein